MGGRRVFVCLVDDHLVVVAIEQRDQSIGTRKRNENAGRDVDDGVTRRCVVGDLDPQLHGLVFAFINFTHAFLETIVSIFRFAIHFLLLHDVFYLDNQLRHLGIIPFFKVTNCFDYGLLGLFHGIFYLHWHLPGDPPCLALYILPLPP